ncbi:unnamed protein product [Thelazia callipaeda]|uniref:PH domain-containing protein n=1 Tax=Thelazia callipaeda TaxID=103827 RepID=A0A0N5CP21_THECL|nr:unnamed protein product [Thelazia callipaeda]
MILKQGIIYKHVGKGKWADFWYICSYEEDGVYLIITKDSSTKKTTEKSINLKAASKAIRFGTTCNDLYDKPEYYGNDPRIHPSAYIAILAEKMTLKKDYVKTLWLCAQSTLEMFEMITIISRCHMAQKLAAPSINAQNDSNALHHYLPIAFDPKSSWEKYYDNPSSNEIPFCDLSVITSSIKQKPLNVSSTPTTKPQFKITKAPILEEPTNIKLIRIEELPELPLISPKPSIIYKAERNCENLSRQSQFDGHDDFQAQTGVNSIASTCTIIVDAFLEPKNSEHIKWQSTWTNELSTACNEYNQNLFFKDENLHIKIQQFKNKDDIVISDQSSYTIEMQSFENGNKTDSQEDHNNDCESTTS